MSSGPPPKGNTSRAVRSRVLRRFYEPLVLLKVLDPTRGKSHTSSISESKPESLQLLWRKFLDQLSWICDHEPAGNTVSSIAVQATPQGPVYWLAANSNTCNLAVPHLEWVLRQLESSYNASASIQEGLEKRIFLRCIEFSQKRVKTYSRTLCALIRRRVEYSIEHQQESDGNLLRDLQSLERLENFPEQLCFRAYNFRDLDSSELLSQKGSESREYNPWAHIRHYIGRLGSWSKASRTLVLLANRRPHFISGFRIDHIVSPPPVAAPAAGKTTLETALGRMLPAQSTESLREIKEILDNFPLLDVSTSFVEAYTDKSFKPRVHAELLVLEHFYHNNLEFVDHDAYIGCSKPSCFCCDLYMKYHPGQFVQRPCHGNLWTSWRPPVQPLQRNDVARKHTESIMNRMVERIRQDLMLQILSKEPRRSRVPDSATGITSSLADLILSAEISQRSHEDPLVEGTDDHPNPLRSPSSENLSVDERESPGTVSPEIGGSEIKVAVENLERISVHGKEATGTDSDGTTDSDDDVVIFRGRGGMLL